MVPAARPDSIFDRIDRALAQAAKVGRTPVTIVVGKDDGPAFRPDLSVRPGDARPEPLTYGELPVRLSQTSFLSRLEFKPVPGQPNAVLL